MNKILKALLASFVFLGSVCSLASCNNNEAGTTAPGTDIVDPHPGTETTPDEFVPEVHEDWPKAETTEADIMMSLKDGLSEIPADSAMWVWCWGGEPQNLFVPLIDFVAHIPTGTTGCVIAFMPKGVEANWDIKLGQTTDMNISGGKITGVKPVDPAGTKSLEINIDNIKKGLEAGSTLPEEYDLYVYPMGGISENIFIPVVDGKCEVDSYTSSMYVAFIEKGKAPAWGNALAKTIKLQVKDNEIIVPEQIKPEDLIDFTVDEKEIGKHIKGDSIPEMADIYAFTWSNDVDGGFYRVTNGSFKAPKTAVNIIFVYIVQDTDANWENALAQTTDMIIENGKVVMDLNAEFSVDMSKVANSLKPGEELPAEYELFVWAFYSETSGRFCKVTDGKFTTDRRCTGAVLVFMPKGSENGDWGTKLCQSADLEIKNGAVVLPEKPAVIEMIDYAIDLELIALNLKDGKTMPAEYDLYVFAWTSGVLDGFNKVEGATYKMDSRVTEFLFALVEKGKEAAWGPNVLAQTENLKTKDGQIVYPITEKPAEPVFEDYTLNVEQAGWNILPDKAAAPTEGFDLYVHYWGKGFAAGWVKVVDGKVSLDNRVEGALVVYVATGDVPTWDNGKVITQTSNMKVVEHTLVFEITEKPVEPDPEPQPETVDLTADLELVALNMKEGTKLPTDAYDLYAVYTADGVLTYVKATDNVFTLPKSVTSFKLAMVASGAEATAENTLAETIELTVAEGKIVYPTVKPVEPTPDPEPTPETVDLTANLELVALNMKEGNTIPAEYDLYAVYTIDGVATYVKATDNIFTLPKSVTTFKLVMITLGAEATVENTLAETVDLTVEAGAIVYPTTEKPYVPVMVTYTVDLKYVAINMKDGKALPDSYDLYVATWTTGISEGFLKVVDNSFELDSRVVDFCFVMMEVGTPGSWNGFLAQTNNLTLKDGAIVYPNTTIPEEAVYEDYTINLELLPYNIAEGKVAPTEGYVLYVWSWGKDVASKFIKVEGNIAKLDNRVTGMSVVYFADTETNISWGKQLCKTQDLQVSLDKVITYPVPEIPADPVYEDYTLNVEQAAWNIEAGQKEAPAEGFDLYVHYWGKGFTAGWVKVVDGKVSLDNRVEGALVVYVLTGDVPTWDNGKVITKTTSLTVVEHTLVFAVTENPNPTPTPDPQDPVAPDTGDNTNPQNPDENEGGSNPEGEPQGPEQGGEGNPTPDTGNEGTPELPQA